jgi:uncharacterized protein (DUF58 family)
MSERLLLAKRIEGLSLIARQKVASFLSGNRRSLFLGHGTEFADLREYVYGDDLRYIDWRASAKRQNSLIVRDFEVERNANIMFILDSSASMMLGKGDTRARDAAVAIASLAYASIMNKDFFGFGAFSSSHSEFIPPRGGKEHEFLIYRRLLNIIPEGKTSLGEGIKHVAANLTRRSIIMVLSDLHDNLDDMIKGFRIAKGFNHEIQVIQLSDYGEYIMPDKMGKVKFIHPETKKPEVADFADPVVSGIYSYEVNKAREEISSFKRRLRGLNISVYEARTEDLTERVLLAYFKAKQRGIPG